MMKVVLLVCAATLARPECQERTARLVVQGPDARSQMACAVRSQAFFAETALTIDESEYDIDAVFSGAVGILGNAYYPEALRELEARRSDTVEEPGVIGSDTVQLTYRMELMCNEETQDLGEDIHYEAWTIFGLPEIL